MRRTEWSVIGRWWLVSSGFSLEARGEGPLLVWKWPTLVCSRSDRGASTTRATAVLEERCIRLR